MSMNNLFFSTNNLICRLIIDFFPRDACNPYSKLMDYVMCNLGKYKYNHATMCPW